jgi:DNA-binding MarR family transcriptional regulator
LFSPLQVDAKYVGCEQARLPRTGLGQGKVVVQGVPVPVKRPAKAIRSRDAADHEATLLMISRRQSTSRGSDNAFRRIIRDFFAVASGLQEVRERIGSLSGLTGTQFGIFIAIFYLQEEHGVTVGALAEHVRLRPNFVTMELSKLHRTKLIQKHNNPLDRRSVLLTLSPKGTDVANSLIPILRNVNDELFRGFGHAEFHELGSFVQRMTESIDDMLLRLRQLIEQREDDKAG